MSWVDLSLAYSWWVIRASCLLVLGYHLPVVRFMASRESEWIVMDVEAEMNIRMYRRVSAIADISAVLLDPTAAPMKYGESGSVYTGPCMAWVGMASEKMPQPAGVYRLF